MISEKLVDDVFQIDCNNPAIDVCVAGRYGGADSPLSVTNAGKFWEADHTDNVPYGCPLTQAPENEERDVEKFVRACDDCVHSFVALFPDALDKL